MNVVDDFLQRPEAHGNPLCQHHLHQVLLYGIFSNLVISNQDQIRPREPDPLHANLAVD